MAAAFSRHLSAAARHAADAALAAARRDRDDDDDIECLPSPSSLATTTTSSGGGDGNDAGARGDNGSSGAGGGNGGSSSSGAGGGNNNNGDDGDVGDNLEAFLDIVGHVYEWIGLLAGTALPVPIYFALPEQRRASAAWTWTVLGYGVAFTLGVTFVSMPVFRSACCLCTSLRALLLAACLFAEIVAACRMLPASTLTLAGATVSMLHLLGFYLAVWKIWPPRRRRRC